MKILHASHLTNDALVKEVGRLALGEREATVTFIVHLGEFDARRLYAGAGFPSTFAYCLEVLRLSEDVAFNRIEAARAVRAFPAMRDMLVRGALSPTTARMLRRYLTPENQRELLSQAGGRSKQQVEMLLASRFPRPDVPTSIRRSPQPGHQPEPSGTGTLPVDPSGSSAPVAVVPIPASSASGPPETSSPRPCIVAVAPPIVKPLSAETYEIRFTASAAMREKLREAQDLLAGSVKAGDLGDV